MRGYLVYENGKVVEVAVATNAGVSTQNEFWLRAARRTQFDRTLTGLFRGMFTTEGNTGFVERGRRVQSAETEAKRLFKLADKPRSAARTGSPGIQGYQQRADASYSAQLSARAANRDLAAWLTRLAESTERKEQQDG